MTTDSPDYLAQPRKGTGVRRLNRVPLLLLGGLIGLAFIGIVYTFYQRQAMHAGGGAQATAKPTVVDDARPPVRPSGDDYVQAAEDFIPSLPPPERPGTQPPPAKTNSAAGPTEPGEQDKLEEARMQLLIRLEEQRIAALEAARQADSEIQAFRQRQQQSQQSRSQQLPVGVVRTGRSRTGFSGMR